MILFPVDKLAASLKEHPDALLALALSAVSLLAVTLEVDPWLAFGIPAGFFVLYAAKGLLQDWRKEHSALKEVEKIEKLEGAKVPRKRNAPPPPSRQKGRARQTARKE